MDTFSIYIHVPWCRRRCPYCDFYLVVGKPDHAFIDALIKEWGARGSAWQPGLAQTLYFGGGTPSMLTPEQIGFLIGYFRQEGILVPDAEITIEANPEDITKDYAHKLSSFGVNRISLGIQSFDDKTLRHLGRKHTAMMAKNAIDTLKKAGFSNLSVDLIIGTGEPEANLMESVRYVNDRGIPHVSAYLLTIEEGTNFHKRIQRGVLAGPTEDAQADRYSLVQSTLSSLGYVQYDISSYAKPGFMSRHNQVYWGQGSYLGLGPGAHSMRFLPDGGLVRSHNQATVAAWLNDPVNECAIVTDQLKAMDALGESLAFGLRNMVKGIHPLDLAVRHKTSLPKGFFLLMEKFKSYGWLGEQGGVLSITPQGALFADAIMRDILSSGSD